MWCRIQITLILFIFNVNYLSAQETKLRTARLFSLEDSIPIYHAHVVNISTQKGTITNEKGLFVIHVSDEDSIFISAIGYLNRFIPVKVLKDSVYISKQCYELENFDVFPNKTFQEFKKDFLTLEIKDTVRKLNMSFKIASETLKRWGRRQTTEGGFGVRIPIGKGSPKRKIHWKKKLVEIKKEEIELADKFNAKMIKRVTGLKHSADILSFMRYCAFTKSYLLNNSKYEIMTRTIDCYQEYINE